MPRNKDAACSDVPHVFKDKRLESQLKAIEEQNYDGIDKTWVNNIMLAQHMHYTKARKRQIS